MNKYSILHSILDRQYNDGSYYNIYYGSWLNKIYVEIYYIDLANFINKSPIDYQCIFQYCIFLEYFWSSEVYEMKRKFSFKTNFYKEHPK